MKITRFYDTEDGESRFDEIEIPIEHARDHEGQTVLYSNGMLSPAVRFVELPEGFRTGWHHAPTRQIVVVLSGVLAVGTSDGHTR
jgi:quercetin dioxygenase-like cupin family protein